MTAENFSQGMTSEILSQGIANQTIDLVMKTNEEMRRLLDDMDNITAPKNNISEDKAQVSLIPMDIIVPMLEPAYREGIIKYQRESWRLGFNSTVMYDALMRHLNAWFFSLESYDPDTLEKFNIEKHHLGAAMFCLINLYVTDQAFPALDNRPLKILEEYKNAING